MISWRTNLGWIRGGLGSERGVNTARLLLPSLLLLYFVWRSMRQRVFLLGLPVLMVMYYSVFFEGLTPFWMPSEWQPADKILLWLCVVWLIYFDLMLPWRRRTVRERRLFGPRPSLPEEAVMVGFAAYVLLVIGLTAVRHMDLGSALGEARPFIFVGVGYCLLRGILCHASRKDTLDLLAAIVVVNTIAAVLYILHQGLHIENIYVGVVEHESLSFAGQRLTRSFYFMPQFLPLAIAFCIAKRKWGIWWLLVLVISLAAIWVSYTRALLIVALVEIVVMLGVLLLKRREASLAARRLLQVAAVVVVFVGAAFTLLPTESAYLVSRVSSTGSGAAALQDQNFQVRVNKERTALEWSGDNGPLLGAGFVSSAQDSRVSAIERMAPDALWIPLLYRLGLVGVAFAVALFAAFAWRATNLSLSGRDDAGLLPLVLFGVVIGVFLQGFVQWTILNPWQTPMALWFIALITAETCRRRAEVGPQDAGDDDALAVRDQLAPLNHSSRMRAKSDAVQSRTRYRGSR